MKNRLLICKGLLFLFLIASCNNDDDINNVNTDFMVAFEKASISFQSTDSQKDVKLLLSEPATADGSIQIEHSPKNAVYGANEDFTTNPAPNTSGILTIPVSKGSKEVSFQFTKLKNPLEGTEKSVQFSLVAVDLPNATIQGNTNLLVSFTPTASLGGSFAPEVGGPNEPNQVYIDLSSETQVTVKRDVWDLGFYNGDAFRVKLNGSIFMGAAKLNTTDINSVTEADVVDLKDSIATRIAGSGGFFDDPTGDVSKTAIAEVSATESENKVYLVKLGYAVSDEEAQKGSVKLSGALKGWKKIRILRNGNDYTLQYADLHDTTFSEVTISKAADYNFTFFSFDTKSTLQVEPPKTRWDLAFTVFTNIIPFGGGQTGAYGYSDFVVHNLQGGVSAYMVEDDTDPAAYDNFTLAKVDDTKFTADQRNIGSNWRSVFKGSSVKANRFFVLKDSQDNIYKIKFTALVNDTGERGYPAFQYQLLNE